MASTHSGVTTCRGSTSVAAAAGAVGSGVADTAGMGETAGSPALAVGGLGKAKAVRPAVTTRECVGAMNVGSNSNGSDSLAGGGVGGLALAGKVSTGTAAKAVAHVPSCGSTGTVNPGPHAAGTASSNEFGRTLGGDWGWVAKLTLRGQIRNELDVHD